MKIGITGATGFVARHIIKAAREYGDTLIHFSRHPKKEERLFNTSITPDVNDCEALIHLAGEPIFGLWTRSKRKKILESRSEGTRRLVEAITKATIKPRVLVCASAIGYYGDRAEEILEESSSKGSGFLAEVASAWEQEARQAEKYGVRVVSLRFGLILEHNLRGFLCLDGESI